MTRDEFRFQMARLDAQWPKVYSADRMGMFWKRVQDFPGEWFTKCVDNWLMSCRQAPLGEELMQELSNFKERNRAARSDKHWEAPKNASCDYCKDLGYFVTIHREEISLYAFKCHCSVGRQSDHAFPHFTSFHKDHFAWCENPGDHDSLMTEMRRRKQERDARGAANV